MLPKCNVNRTSSVNGLAAIHFAVTWSWALEKHIRAGADINVVDIYGRSPIHLAVALGKQKSVEILLQADCALFTRDEHRSLLQEAMRTKGTKHDQIIEAVVRALIDRHRRLVNFALAVLPVSAPLRSQLDHRTLIEDMAPVIINELESRGFGVPPALHLDKKSVYDFGPLLDGGVQSITTVADALWNAGFRQVDEAGVLRLSPMLQSWYMGDMDMIR